MVGLGSALYLYNAIAAMPSHGWVVTLPSWLCGAVGLFAALASRRYPIRGAVGAVLAGVTRLLFDVTGFLVNPNLPGLPGMLLLTGAALICFAVIIDRRSYRRREMRQLALVTLLPLAVAVLSFFPLLFLQAPNRLLIVLALVAPVLAAFLVNRFSPANTDRWLPVIGALPLLLVYPLAVVVDVALMVLRGQAPDSSEVAMTWGIGLLLSPLLGLLIVLLAAAFGALGARLKRSVL